MFAWLTYYFVQTKIVNLTGKSSSFPLASRDFCRVYIVLEKFLGEKSFPVTIETSHIPAKRIGRPWSVIWNGIECRNKAPQKTCRHGPRSLCRLTSKRVSFSESLNPTAVSWPVWKEDDTVQYYTVPWPFFTWKHWPWVEISWRFSTF